MKDIAVIIQSRDRVEEFINTVDMLYTTCYDQKNFNIIGVVDDDQIQLYSKVKDIYPDIIWLYPKHTPGIWVNLIKIQHDFVKNNDYYFIWAVCDDFCDISKNWDFSIITQKNKYPDGLFTIHSSSKKDLLAEKVRKNAYINNDNNINNIGLGIYYNYCERLPVNTKKWIEFMSPILLNPKFCTQHELITASLVMLLKYHYGINRLVTCDEFYWGNLVDQGGSSICDRAKNYLDLVKNQYEELIPIIEKMYNEISKINNKYMIKQQKGYVLTQDQINFYHENGYLHLKKVFSEEQCQLLIEEADKHAKDHYTNYLNLHLQPEFRSVHTGKTMCDIGDALLPDRAVPIGSIFFFCKPNNPLELGSTWHQDNYAGKSTDGGHYLNLALSLDDAEPENGSLIIVPKSHKYGTLPCDPKPNFAYDKNGKMYQSSPIGNNCDIPEGLEIVHLTYERGDVLAVHGNLVHKAEKNNHPTRWRRTMYFVYVNDGSAFWPGWTARRELLERYDSPKFI